MLKTNYLNLSWSVSRGMDTYGYNICRLDDRATGKRYKCMGGGYDMTGTVIGKWLQDTYQDRLAAIAEQQAGARYSKAEGYKSASDSPRLYGMCYHSDEKRVSLDGACGKESMIAIARAIGVDISSNWNRRANRGRGATDGYFVTDHGDAAAYLAAEQNARDYRRLEELRKADSELRQMCCKEGASKSAHDALAEFECSFGDELRALENKFSK